MYRSLSLNTLGEFCIFNEPKAKERCESKQTSVCVISKIFNLLFLGLLLLFLHISAFSLNEYCCWEEFSWSWIYAACLVCLLCSFADFLTIFYGIFKAKGNKNHRNFINCNKSAAEFNRHNEISYCKAGVKSGSHDTFL